jgi:hypothetical protein
MKLHNLLAGLLLAVSPLTSAVAATPADSADFRPIHNDTFWHTADGQPLYSQGGGIFRFPDSRTGRERYFWYGVRYAGARTYLNDPSETIDNAVFEAVTCYSSDNLVDWTDEGDVLTNEALAEHGRVGWVGRLGVAYIAQRKSYALLVQYGGGLGSGVLFLESDSPTAPFRWHRLRDMADLIGTHNSGDQTVFTDPDDGRSYLVYSYGNGRNRIYVSEIGVRGDSLDLLDCTQVFRGESREGNCMFKRGGRYYMCASNIYGWDGSFAYYLVADNIRGPYLPTNDMQVMPGCEADYAHVSQTGFFYTLRRDTAETVLFCGDRWCDFAGNGLGYNQWVPLSFSADGIPYFNSLSSWSLSESTAQWRVNPDNNYVRNGSFEADRRSIPNPVKPRQEYLLGWTTEYLQGRPASVADSLSPRLNYMNTREDRRHVIGEKSLCISDREAFHRRVSQEVASTPYVPLPDGRYTLRARIRTSGRFRRLTFAVESGGKCVRRRLRRALPEWTDVVLPQVPVSGGRARIVIDAQGEAGACCLVDDVTFSPE